MTIVGYDDDFWVDINNNNNKDNGEIGAFKVANSWGTSVSNYTNGYVWLAYDAVGDNSSVANAPTDRAGAFDYYYFIEPEIDYMPLLIANVRMKSKRRNQIAVKVGLSNIDSTTPDELISVVNNYNIAFNNASEGFVSNDINVLDRNFSGGKILQAITIPFDLTPVIKKEYAKKGLSKNADIRLYIEVTDANNNGFDVKLGKVEIIEPMTGKKVECLNENTLAANNNSVMKTVDFQVTPFIGFDENQDITLTFNSNIQENTVANNIYLAKNNTLIYPEYDVISNKIIIYPPDTGYINDTNYEIHINDELISMGGNTIESDKTILLYILDDYYVFE